MTTMMTTVRKRQEQFLDFMERVETPMVEMTEKAAERMSERMGGKMPERPTFMASWPTMREVMENQIDFTTKLVTRQAKMARKMVAAMGPKAPRRKAAAKPTVPAMSKKVRRPARKPAAKAPVTPTVTAVA